MTKTNQKAKFASCLLRERERDRDGESSVLFQSTLLLAKNIAGMHFVCYSAIFIRLFPTILWI